MNGFTLIETLLYSLIAALMLGSLAGFYILILESGQKNQTIAEVEQQGNHALSIITQAIRNAEAVTSPSAGGPAASTLVLDMYDSGEDPTTFDVDNNQLRICSGSGCTATAITSSDTTVLDVQFTNLTASSTPGTVKIQFTLDLDSSSGRQEFSFPQTFYGSGTLRQPE